MTTAISNKELYIQERIPEDVVVSSAIAVLPGALLTPCVRVGVHPIHQKIKKSSSRRSRGNSYIFYSWSSNRKRKPAASKVSKPATGSVTKEDEEWLDRSSQTLKGWMADNEY
jgi:hypothetical protein